MRYAMVAVGVALVLTGGIWILQGTGVLKGSFMTGSAFWGWMGGLALVVGAPLVALAFRRF